MTTTFHETGDHDWQGKGLYREVVLVDSAELRDLLNRYRPFFVAFTQIDFELGGDALNLLKWVCPVVTCSSGRYHYARIILMTERQDRSIQTLLDYFARAFPELLDDRRVFVSVLRRTGDTMRDLQTALGAADPIGRNKHGEWAVLPFGMSGA